MKFGKDRASLTYNNKVESDISLPQNSMHHYSTTIEKQDHIFECVNLTEEGRQSQTEGESMPATTKRCCASP
jgi:hypothetical protein